MTDAPDLPPAARPGDDDATADERYIVFEDVYKSFGSLDVLKGVSFSVRKGETLVIIGQSGTGKSVTLKCLLGLLRTDAGRIFFEGRDVTRMNEVALVDHLQHFGMLFQMAALFDSLTVGENVAFGLEAKGGSDPREVRRTVTETLRAVGLPGIEDKMPADLSGGMKKRVGLARAIAMGPDVVLYDEPTTGLDPVMGAAIDQLIRKTQQLYNVTAIAVTHDMKSAYTIGDRIIMLHGGEVVGEGTPEEIQNTDDPLIDQFIHGKDEGPLATVR